MKKLTNQKLICQSVFALCVLALSSIGQSATLVELQGGDVGEGYLPLANVFATTSFAQPNPNVLVQGVTFNTNASAISITSPTGNNFGGFGFFVNTTANDQNLGTALGGQIFNFATFSIGISGLNVGQSYQIDSFFALLGGSSRYIVSNAVGLNSDSSEGNLASPFLAYSLTQTLTPDALGSINITYTAFTDSSKTASDFPVLNALSVTSPVPEPSTSVMMIAAILFGTIACKFRSKSGLAK